MVGALIGLIVGLICRLDILGIKTRLCRSKKRRPPPTDQVSPLEELPLNKMNTNRNSNGIAEDTPLNKSNGNGNGNGNITESTALGDENV